MRQHAIHRDVQARGSRCGSAWQLLAGLRAHDLLALLVVQQCSELFSRIAHAIGAEMQQREALQHAGGLGERVLGSAEQGEQFIKRL